MSLFKVLVTLLFLYPLSVGALTLNLWHAYRGREKTALEHIVNAYNLSHEVQIDLLAVPFDAYSDKLRATIPLGNGPDFFIAGSSAISRLANDGLILPLETYLVSHELDGLSAVARRSVEVLYSGAVWGLPANVKTLVLFYQKDLIRHPPKTTDELFKTAAAFTRSSQGMNSRRGLAYEIDNFYYHAAWFHAFGGRILRKGQVSDDGVTHWIPCIDSSPFRKSAVYVYEKIVRAGIVPDFPSRHEITHLFNTKNALFVINGQWFRGEIDRRVNYAVAPLPRVSELQIPMRPYVTVECYLLSAFSRNQRACVEAMRYLTSPAMSRVMLREAGQTPTCREVWQGVDKREVAIQKVFRDQAETALPVPNVPEMASVWSTGGALSAILHGKDPVIAAKLGQLKVSNEIALLFSK